MSKSFTVDKLRPSGCWWKEAVLGRDEVMNFFDTLGSAVAALCGGAAIEFIKTRAASRRRGGGDLLPAVAQQSQV